MATIAAENDGTTGDIQVYEVAPGPAVNHINVNQLSQSNGGGNGNILLTTEDGAINIVTLQSGVTILGSGQVTLDANADTATGPGESVSARGSIDIDDEITTASGNITLDADHDITGNANGDITSGGAGDIAVTADANNSGLTGNDDGTIRLDGNVNADTGDVSFHLTDCDGRIGAVAGGADGVVTAANIIMDPENSAGWVTTAPYYLPCYFERGNASDAGWDRLRHDGQSTDPMGNPLQFQGHVVDNMTYEVMILTGDTTWNHDRESFTVTGTPGGASDSEVVSVWGSGAPPHAVLTVTGFAPDTATAPADNAHYLKIEVLPTPTPPLPPDLDVTAFGTQIRSDADGHFSFRAQRPSLTSPVTFTVEESSGLSRGTMPQTYAAPPDSTALRFDFGTATSPVQTGLLQVVPQTIYSAARGYGWATRVAAGDRRDTVSAAGTPLWTDFNSGRSATFKVDLPDGLYNVRLYHSNPLYFGSVPYTTQPFTVTVEDVTYEVPLIAPGTTFIQPETGAFTVTVSGGTLEILFGVNNTAFMIAGIDISQGELPSDMPLLASGHPLDAGAAAIGPTELQPVVAEAAARWTAVGLTAEQAATLANVQFAVADLGGAYLGLANPAANTVRIDDDAAMMGWSVAGDRSSVIGDP